MGAAPNLFARLGLVVFSGAAYSGHTLEARGATRGATAPPAPAGSNASIRFLATKSNPRTSACGCRFNWSTQHRLEIVVQAMHSLASCEVAR
jgi:hypothetical protein